jgi:hypothetical protein
LKSVNKPNFDISPVDLFGMSIEAVSVGNMFVIRSRLEVEERPQVTKQGHC